MDAPAPPEIVLVAHGQLDRVKEILAERPGLLNVMYEPWAETPLGAASHVGNREIAEFLLERGAPLTITTAAMLGRKIDLDRFLAEDPAQANATGAHGISLLFHTAYSGDVSIADAILAAGGSTESAGHALHAAVVKGHQEMVAWLLAQGADPNVQDYQGKTPLAVAQERGNETIAATLRAASGN
ncbi:MAG TPA: ankyrin repeat domain-containing protein [Anaerolineales bacterium]|nr:ankyrin repeat domain-containing protein [Anaerolineales bacterium]